MCASRPVLLADFFGVWAWDAARTAQGKNFKQAWVKQHIFILKKKKKENNSEAGEVFCFGRFGLVWHFPVLSFAG